jgi:phosphate transport system substrate-binding protein
MDFTSKRTLRPAPRLCAAFIGCLYLAAVPEAVAGSVSIQGSTTFSAQILEPYKARIEQRSGVKIDAIANKSVYGLIALLEGRARMAMISSSLAGEQKHLRKTHPDLSVDRLQAFEVSSTRVAFIAHPTNPVKRLAIADLARVLRGDVLGWRDLGGHDVPIAVVTVQPGGGVPTTVRTKLIGGQPMRPARLIVVEAPSHVVVITSQHKGALGIAQLGLASGAPVTELETDHTIAQQLNYVTLGPPDAELASVIVATRAVALENNL